MFTEPVVVKTGCIEHTEKAECPLYLCFWDSTQGHFGLPGD